MELGNCRNHQGMNREVVYRFHQRKTTFYCISNQYPTQKNFSVQRNALFRGKNFQVGDLPPDFFPTDMHWLPRGGAQESGGAILDYP